MQTSTLLYIVLAVLLSVALAFFQYFYKTKNNPKINILLFALRALSIFLLGLLLINPKIKTTTTENIKPVVSFLVDNSLSVKHFKEDNTVRNIVSELETHKKLKNKFDVNFYTFGKDVNVLDSLSFDETQSDISEGIIAIDELNKSKIGATVLITDGNQTIGNDYEFVNFKKPVFPVVLGDTTKFQDVRISQLNVNKYSYLNNKFPVEVLLYYDGEKEVSSTFTITKEGKNVFSEKVNFSPNQNTKTITVNLKAAKEGTQYFSAGIAKIAKEKNTKNNYKSFAVEVIDEQTKVLVLASVLHPDLGALKKAIASNKQRNVEISLASKFKGDIKDYQLVVFYQPNASFKKWMEQRKSNFVLVTGTRTDWNFINSLNNGLKKESINQTESYGALYNLDFGTYLQKDIQFNEFSPLVDKFGQINITSETQTLLYQKLKGIATQQPLIATFENGEDKWSAIFGEGIWKWRATSFLEENSFEIFDEFIGNLIQYTVSNKKRKRLDVSVKRIYPANSSIDIVALYLDKNYKFDNRANLQVTITNAKTREKKVIPFSLVNNSYKVGVEGLEGGNYNYTVSVEGESINERGRFKVTDYQVEQQFTNANTNKLERLAIKTKGKVYHKDDVKRLVVDLIANKEFYTTQKEQQKEENLINWQWLLFGIVGLLGLEWFVRKYHGKI